MSQTTPSTPAAGKPPKPPLPRFMYAIVNPLMKLMLRSPLHKSMSKQLMILTFTGKKSGKSYSTPVGYVRQGNTLLVFTHSPWWKNFIGGAPVTVRVEGKDIAGTARVAQDATSVKKMTIDLMAANGEKRSRRMDMWLDNAKGMSAAQVAQKMNAQGVTFVKIDLKRA